MDSAKERCHGLSRPPWRRTKTSENLESKSGISISLGKVKLLCDIEQPPPSLKKKNEEKKNKNSNSNRILIMKLQFNILMFSYQKKILEGQFLEQ